jgi:hypothetical protein
MQSIMDTIAENMRADIIDTIQNSNVLADRIMSRPAVIRSRALPWMPITYTSMRAWYIANYSLLALLMILVGAIVWGIISLLK